MSVSTLWGVSLSLSLKEYMWDATTKVQDPSCPSLHGPKGNWRGDHPAFKKLHLDSLGTLQAWVMARCYAPCHSCSAASSPVDWAAHGFSNASTWRLSCAGLSGFDHDKFPSPKKLSSVNLISCDSRDSELCKVIWWFVLEEVMLKYSVRGNEGRASVPVECCWDR